MSGSTSWYTIGYVFLIAICGLLLPPLSLKASEIAATGACYNGTTLTLSEGVELHHPLGRVTALSMVMSPEPGIAHLTLSRVELKGNVTFYLTDGSVVAADYANLDALKREGHLFGEDASSRVTYLGKNDLQLSGHEVMVTWGKSEGDHTLGTICEVLCHGDVEVSMGPALHATGDIARYSRATDDSNEELIVLSAATAEGCCHVTDNSGGQLTTPQLTFYPQRSLLEVLAPQGSSIAGKDHKVLFTCGKASWDLTADKLTLQGGTIFSADGYGEVTATGPVELLREEGEWRYLITEGQTQCVRYDPEAFLQRQLFCSGRTTFSKTEQQITMIATQDTQIEYFDESVRLYGNRLDLSYKEEHDSPILKHIGLTGNVCLINSTLPCDPSGEGKPWQYVLADRFEYIPEERLWLLSSQPPRRVFYDDKLNSIQATAPRVIVQQRCDGTLAIRAIGTTRLAFAERELDAAMKQLDRHDKRP